MYFIETNVWYINIWPAKRCLLRRSWLVGPWPLPPDRKFPGHRQNQESKQDAARPALSIIPTDDGRSRSVGSDPRYIFSDPPTCLAPYSAYCDRLHSKALYPRSNSLLRSDISGAAIYNQHETAIWKDVATFRQTPSGSLSLPKTWVQLEIKPCIAEELRQNTNAGYAAFSIPDWWMLFKLLL